MNELDTQIKISTPGHAKSRIGEISIADGSRVNLTPTALVGIGQGTHTEGSTVESGKPPVLTGKDFNILDESNRPSALAVNSAQDALARSALDHVSVMTTINPSERSQADHRIR